MLLIVGIGRFIFVPGLDNMIERKKMVVLILLLLSLAKPASEGKLPREIKINRTVCKGEKFDFECSIFIDTAYTSLQFIHFGVKKWGYLDPNPKLASLDKDLNVTLNNIEGYKDRIQCQGKAKDGTIDFRCILQNAKVNDSNTYIAYWTLTVNGMPHSKVCLFRLKVQDNCTSTVTDQTITPSKPHTSTTSAPTTVASTDQTITPSKAYTSSTSAPTTVASTEPKKPTGPTDDLIYIVVAVLAVIIIIALVFICKWYKNKEKSEQLTLLQRNTGYDAYGPGVQGDGNNGQDASINEKRREPERNDDGEHGRPLVNGVQQAKPENSNSNKTTSQELQSNQQGMGMTAYKENVLGNKLIPETLDNVQSNPDLTNPDLTNSLI